MLRRLRTDVNRYYNRTPLLHSMYSVDSLRVVFERILCRYVSQSFMEYDSVWVPLLGPLIYCISEEKEVYYCFESLMKEIEMMISRSPLFQRITEFMSMFRTTLPDLFNYFDEEEVNTKEWLPSWLQYFLAKELPLECLLRLWDYYFCHENGFEFHRYICLALLHQLKDSIEELESSEILSLLQRLTLRAEDMESLVNFARNLELDYKLK